MGLFGRKKEQKACCGSNAAETMAGAQTGKASGGVKVLKKDEVKALIQKARG